MFSIAIAQMLLSGSDSATVSDSVPPTLPNLPFPITTDHDISPNPHDSGNVDSVDMNLVASNPVVPTNKPPPETSSLTSKNLFSNTKVAQESPNGMGTESSVPPETLNLDLQTGLDHSDSSCDSVSTTPGRKVRRGWSCPLPGQSPIERFTRWTGLDGIVNLLREGEPSEDKIQRQDPKGELSNEDVERNNKIKKDDEEIMSRLNNDLLSRLWRSAAEAQQFCEIIHPTRPVPLCCLGPQLQPPTGLPKREEIPVNMQNCVAFLAIRPYCDDLPDSHYCCFLLDDSIETPWGYIGISCVHMV